MRGTEQGSKGNLDPISSFEEAAMPPTSDKDAVVGIVAIIPAYNEERSIAKVILLAQRYVDKVVVCDDGSTDFTAGIAEGLGAVVVRHPVNMGKGQALRSALREAMKLSPDIVVTLDADGQHDPQQIPRLVEPIRMGNSDVVVGSRCIEGAKSDPPFSRRLGLGMINFVCRKAMNTPVRDTQSGFRAYSQKAFCIISSCEERGFGVESEQLTLAVKNGLHVIETPINVKYKGLEKTSKKTPLLHGEELILWILRMVSEERPLVYVGLPGVLSTSIGLVLGVYLLWLFNITRYFNLQIAIAVFGTVFIGLLLMIAAVMLHGLRRIVDLIRKKE